MAVTIVGMDKAIANLGQISEMAVPRAAARSVNRIAARAIKESSSRVATQTKVPVKLVRQRAYLKKATARKPNAVLRINRGDLPAINLGVASTRVSKRKGVNGVLKVGNFSFPGAFIQQLSNGRWQVMRRTTKARYPIEVVKIPMATQLTQTYQEVSRALMKTDMPGEFAGNLSYELNKLKVEVK